MRIRNKAAAICLLGICCGELSRADEKFILQPGLRPLPPPPTSDEVAIADAAITSAPPRATPPERSATFRWQPRNSPAETQVKSTDLEPPSAKPAAALLVNHRRKVVPTSVDERTELAAKISEQIVESDRNGVSQVAITPVEPPPGWQAVGEELQRRLAACETLLNRRAYYSAREEASQAMLYLTRVLDLTTNRYHSEAAWHAALVALSEAEDFSTSQRLNSDIGFLSRIIRSHESPVLKHAELDSLSPLAAGQHYYRYAEEKLAEAVAKHPWASERLFALGRSYQSESEVLGSGSEAHLLRHRAVSLFRAACIVNENNALAANQLGFLLLQMDRSSEARHILLHSVTVQPSLAAFENLVEANRRMGDDQGRNWALAQCQHFSRSAPPPSHPAVVEVDVATFAAISPYAGGPNAGASTSASTSDSPAADSGGRPVHTAAIPTSTRR